LKEISAKGTNLAAAVPWPWRIPQEHENWMWAAGFLEGCFYLLFPIFFVLTGMQSLRPGRERLLQQPVLLAASFVCLPYTHYVFSRPDIVHLGHAAPVLILGTIALAFTCMRGWQVVATLLAGASLFANFPQTGLAWKLFVAPDAHFSVLGAGKKMIVRTDENRIILNVETLIRKLAKPDEPILFLP